MKITTNERFRHLGGGQGTKRKRDEKEEGKKKSKQTLSQYQDLNDPLSSVFENPIIDFDGNGIINDKVGILYTLKGDQIWYGGHVIKIWTKKKQNNKRWRVQWNDTTVEKYTDEDLLQCWEQGRMLIWRDGRWWRAAQEKNSICPSTFDCDTSFTQVKQSDWEEESGRYKMIERCNEVRFSGL